MLLVRTDSRPVHAGKAYLIRFLGQIAWSVGNSPMTHLGISYYRRVEFFVLCCLVAILVHSPDGFAETSLEIEVAKAKTILELDKQVTSAKTKIQDAPRGTGLTPLTDELRIKQNALDLTVKSFYALPTAEGVTQARRLVESTTVLENLNKTLEDPQLPPTAKVAVESAIALTKEQSKNLAKEADERTRIQNEADTRFAGFGFGVALGVTLKAGKRQIVNSATVDPNGLVRIDRDNNTTANFILESHYFFTPNFHIPIFNVEPRNWGTGPFVAVQPGTENIIQAVGAGWMIGFKRSSIIAPGLSPNRGDSFNIGLGVMLNPNAQVLGDGIEKDKPLPGTETAIRLKKTTELGWLLTFSYSF